MYVAGAGVIETDAFASAIPIPILVLVLILKTERKKKMKKVTMKDFRRIAKTATHTYCEWCGDTVRGEKAAALEVAVLFGHRKIRLSKKPF